MFQAKIARRLVSYFVLALLVFALIVGVVFTLLLQRQSINNHRDEIARYATLLAQSLGQGGQAGSMGMMGQGMGGYGAYVRFISQVSDTDIWVVDASGQAISASMHPMMNSSSVNSSALPVLAQTMLPSVLEGATLSKDEQSTILTKPTLLIGAPILGPSGPSGAVFMRSAVEGVSETVSKSLMLLLGSMAVALLSALLLTVPLSESFIRPLSSMRKTALALADNHYDARSLVEQHDEIGELACTLDTLAEKLEEASLQSTQLEAMRKDFIVTVSHELRTPVTVMRGSLEALRDGVVTDPEKVREYYEAMLSEAKHLERLVNDLLDLSRLQNTHFTIEAREVCLSDVLNDALRSAVRMATRKSITVVATIGELATILGDYGRLRQMFLVVLDNAIKFSPQGSTVTITAQGHQIAISDEGPGMSDEDVAHMFDRFYRRTELSQEGTGLGLAIAREIATRHNINITAQKNESGGMTLSFLLP